MKSLIPSIALLTIGWAGGVPAQAGTPDKLPDKVLSDSLVRSTTFKEILDEDLPPLFAEKIDWNVLDSLVRKDNHLTESNKISIRMLQDILNPVERDKAMQKSSYYSYLREFLYPKAIKK